MIFRAFHHTRGFLKCHALEFKGLPMLRHTPPSESGLAYVTCMFALVALLGLTALLVDISYYSLQSQRLQVASDVAAEHSLRWGAFLDSSNMLENYADSVVKANTGMWASSLEVAKANYRQDQFSAELSVSSEFTFNTAFSNVLGISRAKSIHHFVSLDLRTLFKHHQRVLPRGEDPHQGEKPQRRQPLLGRDGQRGQEHHHDDLRRTVQPFG